MASEDMDSDLEALRSAVFASLKNQRVKESKLPSGTMEDNRRDAELEELRKAALQSKKLQEEAIKRFQHANKGPWRDFNSSRMNYKRNSSNLIVIQPVALEDMLTKPSAISNCLRRPQDRFCAIIDDEASQSPRQMRTKNLGKFSRFETDSEGESSDSDYSESAEGNENASSSENANGCDGSESGVDAADSDTNDVLLLHPDEQLQDEEEAVNDEDTGTRNNDYTSCDTTTMVEDSASNLCTEDSASRVESVSDNDLQNVSGNTRSREVSPACDDSPSVVQLERCGATDRHRQKSREMSGFSKSRENGKATSKERSTSERLERSRHRTDFRDSKIKSHNPSTSSSSDEKRHRSKSKRLSSVKYKKSETDDIFSSPRNGLRLEFSLSKSSPKDWSSRRCDKDAKSNPEPSEPHKKLIKLRSSLNLIDSNQQDLRNKLISVHKKVPEVAGIDGDVKRHKRRPKEKHRSRSGSPVLKSVLSVVNLRESNCRSSAKSRSVRPAVDPLEKPAFERLETSASGVPIKSVSPIKRERSRSPNTRKVLLLSDDSSGSNVETSKCRRPQINITLSEDIDNSAPRQRLPVHLRLGSVLSTSKAICNSRQSIELKKMQSSSSALNNVQASETPDGAVPRKIKLKWDGVSSSSSSSSSLERKGKAFENDLDEKIRRIRAKNQAILKRKCEIQQDEQVNI